MLRFLVVFVVFHSVHAWEQHTGVNCYTGHGATEIDTWPGLSGVSGIDACQSACDGDATCDSIAVGNSGECYRRSDTQLSHCVSDSYYTIYVKASSGPSPPPSGGDCLCIFDVDRTLTGSQFDVSNCPGNLVQQGVRDTAYRGGDLTLSQLAQALESTFCSKCYIGSISHGDASGQNGVEQGILHDRLATGEKGSLVSSWKSGCSEIAALLTDCHDGYKQTGVPSIIQYYEQTAGATIAPKDVHFFDDRTVNIESFQGTEYNARQISCQTRDWDDGYGGAIGLCGAELSEIVETTGQVMCGQASFLV